MRITFFFPRLKTFSGAEHLLIEITGRLAAWGHEPVIATRGVAEVCRPHLPAGVEVVTPRFLTGLTGVHLVDSLLDVAASPLLAGRDVARSDVFCFIADPVLPALWRAKRRHPAVPAVYYCLQPPRFVYDLMAETVDAHRPLGHLIPPLAVPYRAFDRFLARRGDRIVALSQDYAAWCRELYGRPVEVVPAGVDLELGQNARPERARRRHGLAPDTPLVLTVNKIIARKNLDVFLRAFKIIARRIPEARGVVVGDGPVKPALLRLRSELGLEERVIFTGHLPDFADVVDYYAASDVYVFLEKNVPFGLTVLEASICSTPVVAVNGGGARETLIDGQTGFTVDDHRDAEQVAEKVCHLLADRERRVAMGRRAAEHARSFSWEASARRLLAVFEDAHSSA